MIIDAFPFYNEIEMLKSRLHYLNDVVDRFIIIEGTHSFSGNKKESVFEKNIHLFNEYHDKIQHLLVPNDGYNFTPWDRETVQRNAIYHSIDEFDDDDIFILGDVDEIPPKELFLDLSGLNKKGIIFLCQDTFYYNLSFRKRIERDLWVSVVLKKSLLKDFDMNAYRWIKSKMIDPEMAKKTHGMIQKLIDDFHNQPWYRGGWHLSYFLTPEEIQNKIENFAHQELNKPEFTDLINIKTRIESGIDPFHDIEMGIKLEKVPLDYFPSDFLKSFSKYIPSSGGGKR